MKNTNLLPEDLRDKELQNFVLQKNKKEPYKMHMPLEDEKTLQTKYQPKVRESQPPKKEPVKAGPIIAQKLENRIPAPKSKEQIIIKERKVIKEKKKDIEYQPKEILN